MKKRIILIAAILGSVVGGGLAIADAANTDSTPYKAEPRVIDNPEKLTVEERQALADNDPARLYGESTGLMPVAGYVNAEGESTGYVRVDDHGGIIRNEDGSVDVVTVKGTKVGRWDRVTGARPSVTEVNRVAEEEK